MHAETIDHAKPSLALSRRIKAAPASVYAAWTEPLQIMSWWGMPGCTTLAADVDVRVGGRYRIRFTTVDGQEHEVGGVYREVVPDRRLVFTWAWHSTPERESLVSLDFAPEGDGTLFTLSHDNFIDEPARDRHRQGWSATLDRFERLFG
jgi:uncharacterized protein YndB with AHSA1/START domain